VKLLNRFYHVHTARNPKHYKELQHKRRVVPGRVALIDGRPSVFSPAYGGFQFGHAEAETENNRKIRAMIIHVTYYTITNVIRKEYPMFRCKCDTCKVYLKNDGRAAQFDKIAELLQYAFECDWHLSAGKQYCPECKSKDNDKI
tara:strand:+ start:129 stop:560 length:432 start_codon:yes stop_codon:yes gene_type:complete